MVDKGELTPAQAWEIISPLAGALSVVFTPEEYRGFMGSFGDLRKQEKEDSPVDILGYPATSAEAIEVVRSALDEKGNLRSGVRLSICLQDDTQFIRDVLRQQVPAIFNNIIFTRPESHVVNILRQFEAESARLGQSIGTSPRIKRFFVSPKLNLPADFFDLTKTNLDPLSADELKRLLHVYLIIQTISVMEIPQTHLPNWEAFRQILAAA
jgi:hypothetical protein